MEMASRPGTFIHVDDICQMIYRSLVAEPGRAAGQVFQAATGVETSINNLIASLREVTGKKIEIIYEPERKGEIRRNFADISKAREVLGFEPQVDLSMGLQQLWKWYLNQM
jgi:nucleoside-diphosphate-sugar epimerase